MTTLEFEEIKKEFNIEDEIKVSDRGYREKLSIRPSGSYYAIIEGEIPVEIINKIYDEYPKEKNNIRTEYTYGRRLAPTHKNYLSYLHIDTMESLIIFLTEYLDYMEHTDENKRLINERIHRINTNILSKLNPRQYGKDWLKEADIPVKNYGDEKIRTLLDNFDHAINPYLDGNIDLDNNKGVTIGGSLHDDNKALSIKSDDGYTYYGRDKNGYTYEMRYKLSNATYDTLDVIHFYYESFYDKNESGEYFNFSYRRKGNDFIETRYDISRNKIGRFYPDKRKASKEEVANIEKLIKDSTDLASTMTIWKINSKEKENNKIK